MLVGVWEEERARKKGAGGEERDGREGSRRRERERELQIFFIFFSFFIYAQTETRRKSQQA